LVVYHIVYKFEVPAALRDTMQGLGKLMGLCIAGMVFLYFWKIMSAVYTQPQGAYEAAAALLAGPLAGKFWIGEVLLAMVLPLALILLVRGASVKTLGLAGLIHLVGLFFTRYDFIIAGQLPVMREGYPGSGVHTVNGLAQYAPSGGEWLIFALGLGVFFVLYFGAEKFLNLATPAGH
jgi:molybdopterin-containing oxidoreductase family membrane subunit